MDALADELGHGRRPSCGGATSPTEFPFTTATGLSYDSGDYGKALDLALEMSDYAGFEARRAEAAARGNYRGIGLSTYVEVCGLAPSAVTKAIGIGAGGWESSTVRMHPTGKVDGDHGLVAARAGPRDVVVADRRDRARRAVRRRRGHPRRHRSAPYGLGTYGSRSLAVGRHRAASTCEKVRDKARLLAAHLLECSADDLEWEEGRWQVKGSPDRAKTIQELGVRGLGRRLAARRHRAHPGGDDVPRPAELHVPVRHAHRRGRDRRRDRPGRDRALRRRSTTAATSSTR